MNIKDCVLEAFKVFQVKVERQTKKTLKCIRTDNGGEYRGPFEEYFMKIGIKHERTIVETINCMLSHSKLSRSFSYIFLEMRGLSLMAR